MLVVKYLYYKEVNSEKVNSFERALWARLEQT